MSKSNEEHEEQQRVVAAAAILATILGFIAIFKQPFMAPLKLVLGMSGVFLFAYLIVTAANLKYKHKGDLATIIDTDKVRPYLFDWGISIYGLAFFGSLFIPLLNKEATEKVIQMLINVDTFWGWLALAIALILWAVIYILAQVYVRVWALIKFKQWFWSTRSIRKRFQERKESA